MARGTLIVEGPIDIAQFWPTGSSDADTVKVRLHPGPGAFRFRPRPGTSFKPTRAFDGASIAGRIRRPVVDATGHVVVRLQGVDAPELHYRPASVLRRAASTPEQTRSSRRGASSTASPSARPRPPPSRAPSAPPTP